MEIDENEEIIEGKIPNEHMMTMMMFLAFK
jgi:hypothetical protein